MNPSNENKLLLYCARTRMNREILNQVKNLICLPLNWEEVLKSASWHGIAPLLYHNLKGIQENQLIPQEVLDHLKKTYYGNMVRNMYLFAELGRILEAFGKKGVVLIVLKGAALAKTVYGNIALRTMADIDLLVKKEDLPHAERIISGLGYIFSDSGPIESYKKNHHHIRYFHPLNTTVVEIHWHIAMKFHPLRIRITDTAIIKRWWERAQTVEFSGKKVLVLCPDDLLCHLCLHFLKHRFGAPNSGFTSRGALIQLCDIYQVLNYYRDEINWTRLKHETEEYRIHILIYFTICLLEKVMGYYDDSFHDAFVGFTLDRFDKEVANLIQKRILIREDALPTVPGGFGNFFESLAADTLQKKIKTLLREIFPRPEVLSNIYSVPLFSRMLYLYYVIRPFGLLLKYKKLILGILHLKEGAKEELTLIKWISSKK